MKTNSYLILLGISCILLMIALAPVSAGSLQTVPLGGTVFIGEQGLNVSAAVPSGSTINFYTGTQVPGTSAPQASTTIADATNFYVSPSTFSGNTGNWYLNTSVVLVVSDPSVTIGARDQNDNDITGKAVTSGTPITFRLESNTNVIPSQRQTTDGFATIKVQAPDGTVYNGLYNSTGITLPLTPLSIGGSPYYWQPVGQGWATGLKSGTNKVYKAGDYKFWVELAGLNHMKDNYNPSPGKTVSTTGTVSIASDTVKLAVSSDSIVKGNQFSTTITGSPNVNYYLFVKNINANDVPPFIVQNQQGIVNFNTPDNTNATVQLDSSGLRTIGFRTTTDTKDKTWTIRVQTPDGQKSDEVNVKVLKGQVSVVAAGTGNYYLGDEIKLTGSNTETDTTYLFITGPNLPSAGGQLNNPRVAVIEGDPATFQTADVLSDYSWSYKWQTENLSIDAGSYTVYAVGTPDNKDNLGNAQYGSVSVTVRKPYISATMPSLVAAGDKIVITGNAGSSPNQGVAVWILGKNYVYYKTTSVESDGSFDLEVSGGDTSNLYPGQYFVVIQNPMYNGQFDVYPNADETLVLGTYPVAGNVLFRIGGAGALQGSDAADALTNALNNPAVDDIYTRQQFTVAQPQINIVPITTKMVGDSYTVNGLTNLALDSDIQINVVSSSFKPESKQNASEFSGQSGTVKVIAGNSSTWNRFTFEGTTAQFKPDEYIVQATSVTTNAYGSTLFTVVPYVAPTPVPTPVPTPIPTVNTPLPTPVPTTVNTTVPTTEPTKTPGFGVGVALCGLGVVAFLVMKRE